MRRICIAGLKPMPLILIVSLAVVLAACGSQSQRKDGSGTGLGSMPTPTIKVGYGAVHGCPSDAVITGVLPTANVVVKFTDAHSTVTAHVDNVVEIQLPFGQRWTGPTATGDELQLQKPAGYAASTIKMCLWRFIVQRTGTTQLTFSEGAICKIGRPCPQDMSDVTFTIVVK